MELTFKTYMYGVVCHFNDCGTAGAALEHDCGAAGAVLLKVTYLVGWVFCNLASVSNVQLILRTRLVKAHDDNL